MTQRVIFPIDPNGGGYLPSRTEIIPVYALPDSAGYDIIAQDVCKAVLRSAADEGADDWLAKAAVDANAAATLAHIAGHSGLRIAAKAGDEYALCESRGFKWLMDADGGFRLADGEGGGLIPGDPYSGEGDAPDIWDIRLNADSIARDALALANEGYATLTDEERARLEINAAGGERITKQG